MNGNTQHAQFDPSMMLNLTSQGYNNFVQNKVQSLRQERVRQEQLFNKVLQASNIEAMNTKEAKFQQEQMNAIERAKGKVMELVKTTEGKMTSSHVLQANKAFGEAQNIVDMLKISEKNWKSEMELANKEPFKYSEESMQQVLNWGESEELIYPGNLLRLQPQSMSKVIDNAIKPMNINQKTSNTIIKNTKKEKVSYDDRFFEFQNNQLHPKIKEINGTVNQVLDSRENQYHILGNLKEKYDIEIDGKTNEYYAQKNIEGFNSLVERSEKNKKLFGSSWGIEKQAIWEELQPRLSSKDTWPIKKSDGNDDPVYDLTKSKKLYPNIEGVSLGKSVRLPQGIIAYGFNVTDDKGITGKKERFNLSEKVTVSSIITNPETNNPAGAIFSYNERQPKLRNGKRLYYLEAMQKEATWEELVKDENSGIPKGTPEPSIGSPIGIEGIYSQTTTNQKQIMIPFDANEDIENIIKNKFKFKVSGKSKSPDSPFDSMF